MCFINQIIIYIIGNGIVIDDLGDVVHCVREPIV